MNWENIEIMIILLKLFKILIILKEKYKILYKSISQIHNNQITSKLIYINIINKYLLNIYFNLINIKEIKNILKIMRINIEYFIILFFYHFRKSNVLFILFNFNINI